MIAFKSFELLQSLLQRLQTPMHRIELPEAGRAASPF
jgi:hypothetical protein